MYPPAHSHDRSRGTIVDRRQLAMYPVMFPIYIAEFEHKTEERTHRYQVIVDAHDSQVSFLKPHMAIVVS